MPIKFTDIRITGLDADRTQPSPTALGLRLMYLSLSDTPSEKWCEYFAAERQLARHSMWRRAHIEGEFIVINCVPEELEQYHLNDLKQDVVNSNEKYRQFLAQESARLDREQKAAESERERIEQINKRLKF